MGASSARLLLWATLGCQGTAAGRAGLDAPHAAALVDSVRAFAETVAAGVSARGPVAWSDYLADEPAFFMASEGRLVFPNHDAAGRAIDDLRRTIAHIRLRWGDSSRVDPLAPGLALFGAPYHETRVDTLGRKV